MTEIVIGQTGLIGNSIYKRIKVKIDCTPKAWDELSLIKTINELHFKDDLKIYWAAGQNNNNSREKNINEEIKLVDNFLTNLNFKSLRLKQLNIISSAGSIYAGNKDKVISNKSPVSPISLYGRSRLIIENLFKDFCAKNEINLNIFRLSNVFGVRRKTKISSGLINNLIQANMNRIPINIFVPLFVKQDYIDTEFVSANIIKIVNNENAHKNLINTFIFSRNQSHSIKEIIGLIDRFFIKKTPYVMQFDENANMRKSNLLFKIDNFDFISQKIDPIEYSIKKLILDSIHAKVA